MKITSSLLHEILLILLADIGSLNPQRRQRLLRTLLQIEINVVEYYSGFLSR